MKSKLIAIITVLALIINSPVNFLEVYADINTDIIDQGQYGDNITWSLDENGLLTVAGIGEMKENDDGYSAEGIPWTTYREEIQKVKVEEGITSIAAFAFSGCKALSEVSLPQSLTKIGEGAFAYLTALYSLTIPDGVTTIEDMAFAETAIRTIVIPKGVDTLAKQLFSGSEIIYVTVLNENINHVGVDAFYSCRYLKKVDFKGTVESVGTSAFEYCTKLCSFGDLVSMKNIGDRAFVECRFTDVNFIKGMVDIGGAAFYCGITTSEDKEYIVLPNTVNKIGNTAFYCAQNKIYVHDNVEQVDDTAFKGTSNSMILSMDTVINSDEIVRSDGTKGLVWKSKSYIAGGNITVTNNSGNTVYVNGTALKDQESGSFSMGYTEPEEYIDNIEEEPFVLPTEGECGIGSYWRYSADTKTLSFSGKYVTRWQINQFVNDVQHIVFEEGIESVSSIPSSYNDNTLFTNVIDVTIPASMNKYSFDMVQNSKKFKAFIVDENSTKFKAIDGNLYSILENGKLKFERYAIGKGETTFMPDSETYSVNSKAFYNSKSIKELSLSKNVQSVEMPFEGCEIDKVTVYNSDCVLTKNGNIATTVYCYANSAVEKTCINNGIKYEYISINPVEKIEIVTMPTQTQFCLNEKIDTEGIVIKVTNEDGMQEEVTSGHTVIGDTSVIGERKVVIEYGGAYAEYWINVIEIPEEKKLDLLGSVKVKFGEGENSDKLYFTPLIDGDYRFRSSTGTPYIVGNLYYLDGKQITHQTAYEYFDFEVYNLKAGKTYVLKITKSKGEARTVSVFVSIKGNIVEHEHSYDIVERVVEPTCTSEGYTEYKCIKCLGTMKSDFVEKKEHQFDYIYEIVNATCTTKGYTIYRCRHCIAMLTIDDYSNTGHKYIYTVIEPSETEYGYTCAECEYCGDTSKFNWVEPKGLTDIIKNKNDKQEEVSTEQTVEQTTEEPTTSDEIQQTKKKLKTPKITAKRSGKKIKLKMSSKDKKIKYLIYVKKNGKFKRIKTTTLKRYTFVSKKKCIIRVRTMKKVKGTKIYSSYKRISA